MTWLDRLIRRFRALRHHEGLDRDLSDEMRLHIDLEANDLARSRGLDPTEARRQALVAFGGVGRYADEHRDARGVRWLQEITQDVRYAARTLRRAPAFTLSAALVLALGIGSSTAIFSAVDAVLVARLPYPDDDRLVRIYQQNSPTNLFGLSTAELRAIEAQQRSLSAVGAVARREVGISTGREPRRAQLGSANSGFFRALGVATERGRVIEPSDETPGAPLVVVVGHDFAVREFGGATAALGRTVTIDGVASSVVGVLPLGVHELAGVRAEIWPALQLRAPERRGPFFLRVVARLRDGVTLDAARRDLAAISDRIFDQWASSFQDRTAKLTPYSLRQTILGDAGQTLWLFAGAVALVLLIAIANVASLTLVRVSGRSRETALRTVLGASRSRLGRLLVTESIVVSALGAVVGMALAWGLLRVLIVVIGPSIPRLSEATLDFRAFAFAAAVAVVTGVLIGVYPVVSIFGRELATALRSGDREIGVGRRTHALRGTLVTAQFALALPLLAGAGLLLNSFVRLQRVDAGFDPRLVSYVHVSLPSGGYADPAALGAFWSRALALVGELPGVVGAGFNESMPPDGAGDINNFDLVDRPVPPGSAQPTSPWMSAGSGFFSAVGVKLLEGRLFTEADTGNGPPVLVVSRSWVRHYSPDRPAIGRQLISGGCTSCPPETIVGVVGDVKYQGLPGNGEAVYYPPAQGFVRDANLFVRTAGPSLEIVDRVRAALRSIEPALPLEDAGSMEDRIFSSVTPQRHWTTLLAGFALAALALAAVGIFGMLSYLVTSRQREIGVRVALGARRSEVMLMIVRRGMAYAIPGAIVGLVVAVLARRRLGGALYDVSATDPTTLGGVTALLLAVAFVACWLPARRAASVDPMTAIRQE